VLTSFGRYSEAAGVVLQRDGKLLVAGWSGNAGPRYGPADDDGHLVLARYLRNGQPDASFGRGGKVENSSLAGAGAIAIQLDGEIVVLCSSSYRSRAHFALARYNADGTADQTFGQDGTVAVGFFAFALTIQPDGRIVAAGSGGNDEHPDFALSRYMPDGSLDRSFGRGGTALINFGGSEGAGAVAVQPDGKLVATGSSDALGNMPLPNEPPHNDGALARYTANGTLDTSFGRHGKVLTTADRSGDLESGASGVAIQPDGKIVAAGSLGPEDTGDEDWDFLVVRYTAQGRLDGSFGNGGKVATDFALH